MAIRTDADLRELYFTTSGVWPDNVVGDISAADLRAGVLDTYDTINDTITDSVQDSDFSADGLMARNGAGVYYTIPSGNFNTAYDHSQATGNPHSVTPEQIGAIPSGIVSGKGELLVGINANDVGVLASGVDTYVLTADSTEGTGLKWGSPGGITSHAATHTNGVDDIQDATSGQKGLMTTAYATKVDAIEAGAQVNVQSDWDALSTETSGILNKPTVPTVDDTAYNATSWNANTDAATKNAIRDKINAMDTSIGTAITHVSNNGSDHSYIDQDVTTAGSPTFDNLTATKDITANSGVLNSLKLDNINLNGNTISTTGNLLDVQGDIDVTGDLTTAGINWTSRVSAVDNNWYGVTYGDGLFVAIANSGTGNRVMTSPDGINWTSRTSATDNGWLGVTYGNGLFVAVVSTSTGNIVMTSGKKLENTISDNNIHQGDHTFTGDLVMTNLPTSDPLVAGALWNDSGTVKVSAG